MNDATRWEGAKENIPAGTRLRCTVTRHAPFGVFTTIPGEPFEGLIQITDFKDEGRMTADQFPPIGSDVDAVVLGFKETGHQIWLGMKPSQLACCTSSCKAREPISVGLRVEDGRSFAFFGIDEINARLAEGWAVVAVEEGNALMEKVGEQEATVRLRLAGFCVTVIVETSIGKP